MSEPSAQSTASDASLTLSLLGNTLLEQRDDIGEARVVLASGKPLALLSFLHCAPALTATREQLLELLWSDSEPESARHTLRQTLWYIKRRLGSDPLATTGDGVRLALALRSDRQDFLAALDADDPERALLHYRGEFFPDFAAPGGAGFEHWADNERTRLRSLFIGAATRVVRDKLSRGHARDAIGVARRAHDLAPTHQGAWRLLLESQLAADDQVGAAIEVEGLERWLASEDIEPDAATVQLLKAAKAGRGAPSTSISGASETPTGLRAELVGREAEFAELLSAFDATKRGQLRHVHVSASAGHGKSRLLDGFAARLRSSRVRVVSVRATVAERTLPYAFAAQLASTLVQLRGAAAVSPDAASTLVALAPSASNFLRAEPDRSTGDDALRRRSMALSELVATLAHDAPLVLLIDDVHWIDAQSRVLLATLATRTAGVPVLLVTAARSADRFIDETPNALRLNLAPLSVDDVGALLMSIGRLPTEPWSDAFVAALHGTSSGSPLLVLETLQLVMEREQLQLVDQMWTSSNPDALIATLGAGRAMQQRIASLPTVERDVLLRLAVVGTAVDGDDVSMLFDESPRSALQELETRGFVTRVDESWRVAHDEIAASVIEMAGDTPRKRANQAVAEYLEQTAGDDLTRLLRAGFHRARANDTAALDRVFLRAVRGAHISGEHAAITQLGREVLGASAPADEVSKLVSRLPLRVRSRPQRWLGGGALALSALALIVSLSSRGSSTERPTDIDATLWFGGTPDASYQRLRLDVRDLDRPDAIELAPSKREPLRPSVLDSMSVDGTLANGEFVGNGLLSRDPDDGMNLYRVSSNSPIIQLAKGAHDQSGSIVSPDHRYVAYTTGEFDSLEQQNEIAILDATTGKSRRLTESSEAETGLSWSLDGSRIAFVRTPSARGKGTVCWSTIDGSLSQCRPLADGLIPQLVLAWNGAQSVLITAQRDLDSRPSLLELNFVSGEQRVVDTAGVEYRVHPEGRVALCRCRVADFDDDVLAVFDPLAPSRKRPVRLNGQLLRAMPKFLMWHTVPHFVSVIRVAGAETTYVGTTQQFRAQTAYADSTEAGAPLVQWRSLDPSVGTIDSAGSAHMLAPGTLRLVASAGGWRADTLAVEVRPTRMQIVQSERWIGPSWRDRWYLVGDPAPATVTINGGSVLRVNGDSHLSSGVIGRAVFDARSGAGVRVRVRAPLDRAHWQSISVALAYLTEDRTLANWIETPEGRDGREPREWAANSAPRTCSMRAPRAEGGPFLDALAFIVAGKGAAFSARPDTISDGRWHTVVLQVFSDGRCGLAVDGRHVATSDNFLALDKPMRVRLDGQSEKTTVEVGDVDAWTGVNPDIKWQSFGKDTTELRRDRMTPPARPKR